MSGLKFVFRYPELEQYYELQETLGSGGFAKVKLGVHRLTGQKVAVKIMDKVHLGDDLHRVYRELRALRTLHHQHICQLFHIIETDRMIYVVVEYCSGGELFDYIVAKERLRESEARSFFRQILSALMYCHHCGYVHRDLKPENLILDEFSNIKLIDFGLVAEPTHSDELLKTCCGSPAYAAPELIKGGPYIGPMADVWSLGVLLYALLNGFLPFDDDNTAELYRLIRIGEYEIPEWLTPGSIAMLAKLLQVAPERRISVQKLLSHPWVMQGYRRPVDWESKLEMNELDSECVEELCRYHGDSPSNIHELLHQWKYDHLTATYLLLLQQKLQGREPKIQAPPRRTRRPADITVQTSPLAFRTISIPSDESGESGIRFVSDEEDDRISCGSSSQSVMPPAPKPTQRVRRISVGQPMHRPPPGEILTLQQNLIVPPSPPVHPQIQAILDGGKSPVVKPPPVPLLTPPPVMLPASSSYYGQASLEPLHMSSTLSPKRGVVKTFSFDARLHLAGSEEKESLPLDQHKVRFQQRSGSLDRILSSVKKAFARPQAGEVGPRRVKAFFDTSTTSLKTSEQVMDELERVLKDMNIQYKRKKYKFRCKLEPTVKRGNLKDLEFALEVCMLQNIDMIGVRRKRYRGDVWRYKEVCKQIFTATRL